MSELVVEKVRDYLLQFLPTLELELFDIQFRREGHGWVLRVFIDNDEGVSLDHCSAVSRELSQYLDVEDFIEHAYHLEISSPGLERPLRSTGECLKYIGKKARFKVREPIDDEKVFEGIIEAISEDIVQLNVGKKGLVDIPFSIVSKARLAL